MALFASAPQINASQINYNSLIQQVLPNQGYTFPVRWGKTAKQLVDSNALNVSALSAILNSSGEPLTLEQKKILNGTSNANVILNNSYALFTLDVLWGIGVNNNNPIINSGPITQSGNDPNNFASTGGYQPLGNLQLGKLNLIALTPQQQTLMYDVATHSYRPCCDNPTAFPDCNHGAAALALVELMISQGNSENATFEAVKEFNSFYFTQYYMYDAIFLRSHGIDWNNVPASYIVGYNFSSLSGAIHAAQYDQKYKLLPQSSNGGSSASCAA
ncbi:MAG: hypothetical protein KGH65_03285 [Candidatus Micrarchaeota archaeon]|nr:hypothetical protein [Candidatus Micrarchaeota archaeon]